MASNTSQPKFSIKLMVHKVEKRVIFAEVHSDFVDTLFSIMTLPIATIVRLLRKRHGEKLKRIGSLNNLYQSLLDLPMNCLSSKENKWMLLNPRTSSHDLCRKLTVNINDQEPTKYFICQDFNCILRLFSTTYASTCNLAICSHCGKMMNREVKYEDLTVKDDSDGGVFVYNLTTFIVTDDLRVIPNSPGSSIQLLCELGITDVSCLDNISFNIGVDQIFNLLEGALASKNPLTCMVFPGSHYIQGLGVSRGEPLVKNLTKVTTANSSSTLKLKVTMQKSTAKFLFAEGDYDFVEFVFGFLEIPLGTVIGKLLNGASIFLSLNNLFSSISSLGVGDYIKSNELKNMLLEPHLVQKNVSVNQIFPVTAVSSLSGVYSSYCHSYLKQGTFFASLTRSKMSKNYEREEFHDIRFKDSRINGRYLNAPAKFMLTDDLVITPLSSFSSITTLGKLKVPLNDIEVHELSIGIDEVNNVNPANK
ncbi:hypothetical protein HanOQP8_Chr02g0075371 [Helianthus annuus]|nr:hypothetical protein HanOQP8_Chr02g0075371 [Helianthus annuus]